MMKAAPVSLQRYGSFVGTCVGVSPWLSITQDLIDQFAHCTRDEQFIHVDPAKAVGSPFGGTVAHGFLTLSLLSHLAEQCVPEIADAAMRVNLGFNSVRFLSPVRSGHAIRGRFVLTDFAERKLGQWRSVFDVVIDLEQEERPAVVAQWIVATFMTAESLSE